ncbi:MAG: BMP family ABC transporter substrate-binding protein [Deltaproteobacteria bacterium]|jgi:basic membrane protein A|nr:BMP family ABC transporter substrate-binding protein [Deltaproteobacteria bacterium]
MKIPILSIVGLAIAACIAFTLFITMTDKKDVKAEWSPGVPIEKESVKIGVIHVSDPENEKSGYAYAHYLGIREMQSEIGLRDDQIIRKINVSDTDTAATELAIRQCIEEGANIIIATSWWHMDACEKLSGEYPSVIFAHATGNKHNNTNFTNYFGRIYQARYLSGIVAGLLTMTNKIGYVAAMGVENSEVTGGIDAFAIGVESVNPDARVYVQVTYRWLDPAGESRAARELIAERCDVIAQHCNTPNPQIEAQRAGVWGIGFNSDMENDAPDATVVSVVWNWGVYYSYLVKSVINGTFTTSPYVGDIKNGMVGLSALNERILPHGVSDAVNAAREKIESGQFGVFDGVMETNDGKSIGESGKTLSDAEIAGIDWYYRGIIQR